MNSLNILHISDAHIQEKDESDIAEMVVKLTKDVLKVECEYGIKLDLVCFTGDLIQRGDMATVDEKQMEIANKILIKPILEKLGLQKSQFLIIPGNHEVDVSKIKKATEKGLLVHSLEEINENIADMNESYLERIEYFYKGLNSFYDDIISEKIGYAFVREINDKKVGIICLDTSWRSSGKGNIEKGLMYVGQSQVKKLYNHVKNTDFKICMMHHPLEWLSEYESTLIERELTKVDVVLSGHVHENDTKKVCRQNMKTIYSTAGKLFPLDYAFGRKVDGYNGYSILNVDFKTNLCTVFIRSYFAKDREDFDAGVNVIENGKVIYTLNGNTSEKQMEFNIVKGIGGFFKHMSEKFALIKEIDSHAPATLEQVFVEPILSEESEYKKENNSGKESVSLEELGIANDNVIILGKKESGKSTILQKIALQYIQNYDDRGNIPIYIDMRQLPKKKDKLKNATIYFIMDNVLEDSNINKSKIVDLIKIGKILFLIDNVDISNEIQTRMLADFITENSHNRFFLTITEEFFQSIDIKKIPDYGVDFKKIYIHYMGKAQIRELVSRWAHIKEDFVEIDNVVEKIDGYCNQINFAKTPFNVSVFMVIWDDDKNFIPQNEGIVMQRYMEILLEKLSPSESDRSKYSFKIKQHFLSTLAYQMLKKDECYFTAEEFNDFIYEYHKKKGYIEANSKFSTIFFDKGILSFSDNVIVFSYTSIFEYYLAVYAQDNEDFLQYMLSKGKRTIFRNEICFYSGLTLNCRDLLDEIAETITEAIIESIDVVDNLNSLKIIAEFVLDKEELIKDLKENRLTQNEVDAFSDIKNIKNEALSSNTYKKKNRIKIDAANLPSIQVEDQYSEIGEKEAEDFYSLLLMYGSILKNAELLDNKYKISHLENYMYAMNILLGEILQVAEKIRAEMKIEDFQKNLEGVEIPATELEFEKIKDTFIEMMKVSFPIAMQNMILENVGTPKLEVAIDELLLMTHNKPFEKFMLIFLKTDLKIGNVTSDLKRYIQNENSDSILKLILTKLVFYYRMRFFGTNKKIDDSLLDSIIEIQIKLNPKDDKNLTKSFKGNKERVRKELVRSIGKINF